MDSGLYRIYSENIPNFNGDKHMLPAFIGACDDLVISFQDRQEVNNPINRAIVRTIISKLRGHASELVSPRDELNSWPLIKEFLHSAFSDRRSEKTLLNDLMTAYLNKNETFAEFGSRLQLLRSLLVAKLNETGDPAAVKQIKIVNYEQLALTTFINNLSKDIRIIVKCKNPQTLETALQIVANEESEIEYDNRMQKRRYQNFSNSQNSQGQQNFTRNQNFQRTQFPSQHINVQPRNLPAHRFATNQQVFGKPNNFNRVNVFKPNNNFIPRNNPTPMSVQSRIPSVQNNQNLNQNFQRPMSHSQIKNKFPWFKPTQKLNYIAEELHNVENDLFHESISESFEISDPAEQQFFNDNPPNEYPEYYTDEFLEFLSNTPDDNEIEQNFIKSPEPQHQT